MAKKTVWYSKGMGAGGGGFYTIGEAKELMKLNKKMGARKTTFTRIRRKK
jgi:hypothetical protein